MDSKLHLEIVGLITDTNFHVAKCISEELKKKFPEVFLHPKIHPLLEFDWDAYLCNKKRELRGEVWQYSSSLMCFLNGLLLGNEMDLASWAKKEWNFTFTQPQAFYMALTEDYYTKHLQKTGRGPPLPSFTHLEKKTVVLPLDFFIWITSWKYHQFVFMDIEIAGEAVGRLLFELFSDVCPKTSKNFEFLCTGEQGSSQSGLSLCYKGSLFHQVVPNGWVQGGDISPGSKGNGGESIYGGTFEDESFAVSHSKRGILGMANKGPHSNGSQFYITLQPTPWMDKTYVAFGQVVEGVGVLRKLEEIPTCNERPKYECKVTACGVFKQ